jgi:hypothetical protein
MLRIAILSLTLVALAQCQYKAAVLTQTNAVNNIGNELVLLLHDENDELTIAGRFPTWDFLNNGNRTFGSGPGFGPANPVEPLGSQFAVTIRNNRVYAVNAGSNDWTVAQISTTGDGLGFPTTTNSAGSFPVSIDACGELVLVANANNGGVLAGFRLNEDGSYSNTFTSGLDSETTLGTEVPDPIRGVGQVSFIRDCTQAVVTLKDGAATPATSRIYVYEFTDEFEIKDLVKTPFPGDDLIFSFTVDTVESDVEGESDNVFIYTTNPISMSSSSFKIGTDLTATLIETVPNGGQGGACWNQNYRNWMFSGNFGSRTISRFNFSDEGALDLQDSVAASGDSPILDMAGWSNFLYVLFPAEGLVRVYVIDRETGELTSATDGTGLDYRSSTQVPPVTEPFMRTPTGAVGLFAVGLESTDPDSPASFLAPSFLFVLALLKTFF